MKTGLVLEGGAFRTIFSAGVCDAFLDLDLPLPDYLVGVSAGIAYGVSYLSRQSRRNLQILTQYRGDRRYMGMNNFFDPENRSYFGLKFVYETVPEELLPFDYDTFQAWPGTAEAVVTNLRTGQAEYHKVPAERGECKLIEASCALPILFPIIHLDGEPYLDGGCADGIPWERAFEVGCDRVVVVLTRERSYARQTDRMLPFIRRHYREYPNFVNTLERRAEQYNRSREELFRLEQEGKVLVITPESTEGFSRTERDLEKIRALWQDGYFQARRRADEVRAFWQQ